MHIQGVLSSVDHVIGNGSFFGLEERKCETGFAYVTRTNCTIKTDAHLFLILYFIFFFPFTSCVLSLDLIGILCRLWKLVSFTVFPTYISKYDTEFRLGQEILLILIEENYREIS